MFRLLDVLCYDLICYNTIVFKYFTGVLNNVDSRFSNSIKLIIWHTVNLNQFYFVWILINNINCQIKFVGYFQNLGLITAISTILGA